MNKESIFKLCWNLAIILVGIMLLVLTFQKGFNLATTFKDPLIIFPVLITMAFVAEYVDSSLGMGYGTSLTPVLLIMGFSPLQIVPAVLLSEFLSGVSAGFLHHKAENVNFAEGGRPIKIMYIMASCSLIGTVAAVILAVNLPKIYVKLYISIMILTVGIFIFLGRNIIGTFKWWKILGLGTLAAFNKGISGGGYGPLVTGGQILIGVKEKDAIAITSYAEGLVCLFGFILYIILNGSLYWSLAVPLSIGALLSVPAAVITVKILPENHIKQSIGYVMVYLGILALLRLIIS